MAVTDLFLGDLIDHARHRGLDVLSLDDGMARLADRDTRPFVCLTFDDGYRDNYEVAFPVLRRHGAPAAIFLATGLVDRTSPMWWHPLERAFPGGGAGTAGRARAHDGWSVRFRATDRDGVVRLVDEVAARVPGFRAAEAYDNALDWGMIREMSASGLVTFGAHTVSHPLLAGLSGAGLAREIEASRDRCAAMLGHAPRYFAYPFGQPHEIGVEAPGAVAAAGFAAAFTTTAATLRERNTADPFRLPRIMLTRRSQNLASVDAYVSGLTEAIKGV